MVSEQALHTLAQAYHEERLAAKHCSSKEPQCAKTLQTLTQA